MAELDESLYRTLVENLEDLANLLPRPSPRAGAPAAPWEIDVVIPFQGPVKGHLRLAFFGKVTSELAARMAGAALTPEVRQDALGEFANVVCGNVLPFAFGADAVFKMEAPRPAPQGRTGCGKMTAKAEVFLADGRVEGHLCVHDR